MDEGDGRKMHWMLHVFSKEVGGFVVLVTVALLTPAVTAKQAVTEVVSSSPAPRIKVIPQPKLVEEKPFDFILDAQCVLVLGDPKNTDDRFAAETFADFLLNVWGENVRIAGSDDLPKRAKPILIGVPKRDKLVMSSCDRRGIPLPAEVGKEGYAIDVSEEGIVIAAHSAAGVFYGMQTLTQLVEKRGDQLIIPGVRIVDWPSLRYRGISDDISRGPVPTMEYFKKQIRTLALYKINMLTWYNEHMFAYQKHPKIAPPGGALTAEEVKEIVAYAEKYHIEVVGSFQSFGHFYNILKHPEYAQLREDPGGWVISPVKEESYQLLSDFYSELCPLFKSEFFHVNCDETYGLGSGASKELADKVGIGRVYLMHLSRLAQILKQYGKRMMFWGDMVLKYREVIPEIPRDWLVMNWNYAPMENFAGLLQPFRDCGLEQFVCPGVSCWSQIFPNYHTARINIKNFLKDGYKFGAIGMLNTTWDDDGENLFEYNWYGILWSAECAWNPDTSDEKVFDTKFPHAFYGANAPESMQAIELLSLAHQVLSARTTSDSVFWEDPFNGQTRMTVARFPQRMSELEEISRQAMGLIEQARPRARLNAENMDYLAFAARRWNMLARKFQTADWVAKTYRLCYDLNQPNRKNCNNQNPKSNPLPYSPSRRGREVVEGGNQKPKTKDQKPKTKDQKLDALQVQASLKDCAKKLQELAVEVRALGEEYRRLWLLENRQYWLDRNLRKYELLASLLENKANQVHGVIRDYTKTGTLPQPEKFNFHKKKLLNKRW